MGAQSLRMSLGVAVSPIQVPRSRIVLRREAPVVILNISQHLFQGTGERSRNGMTCWLPQHSHAEHKIVWISPRRKKQICQFRRRKHTGAARDRTSDRASASIAGTRKLTPGPKGNRA